MITASRLRNDIIKPTLSALNLYSEAAENLLFGTCAHESHLGKYVMQAGGGPALGIYQMEPNTYNDIWVNFLKYKPDLSQKLLAYCGYTEIPHAEQLMLNHHFATAMCRVHYLRVRAPLPSADDLPGLAAYWKKYYNTDKGKGTVAKFLVDYKRFDK